MSVLLIIAGLIIGIAVFLYLLSTFQSAREKLGAGRSSPPKNTGAVRENINPETVQVINRLKRAPGTRMCPLCGSELTRYEALYASHIKNDNKNKIMIFGCRYCYKPEEDPDKVKKSDL